MSNPYDPYPGQQPPQQPSADAAAPTQFVPIGGQSAPQPGYGAPQDSFGGQSQQQPQAPYGGYPQPGQPGQPGQQPYGVPQQGQPGQPYGAPQQPGMQQPQAPAWGTAPQQPGMQQPGMPGYGAGQQFGGYPVAPQKPTRGTGARIAAGIFGTIVGRVVILALVAGGFAIYHFATSAHRDGNGQITSQGKLGIGDMKVGDCFNTPSSDSNIESVTAIPCTQPHDSQVYYEPKITESTYPDSTTLEKEAGDDCDKAFESSLDPSVPQDVQEAYYAAQDEDTFNQGFNYIVCAIESDSKSLTKSYVTGH